MNKVDFAVCRIKEKLPEPQGFATKGGGCVVYCERLATSWGWKCPYAIVTPSVVLCHNDLASGKIFVAEFLGKDKRGLEAFEMKQMSEVCRDVVGRSLDQLQPDLYLTFLSVEPLDKRGFLKKMVKKGSLQTFRPLDCYFIEKKSVEESTEGLFCRVISDLFSESTGNKPFSTQTFKVVYESQTKRFSLQDFGGYQKTFNQEMPPIGAVIFTNKGEFAGLLRNFSDTRVTPVFLPEPWMKDDGIGEVIKLPNSGNGVCQTEIPGSSAGIQVLESNLRPKSHGSADHLCEEKSLDNDNEDVIVSGDVIFQEQNKLPSSDVVAMDSGLMNAPLVQENNNLDHIEETVNTDKALASLKGLEQNQPFPQNSIPANRNDRIITEGVLISANNYSNDHENVKEGMGSKSPDVTEKSLCVIDEMQGKLPSFHKTEECFDDTVKASDQTGGGVGTDSDLCRTETGLNATEGTSHQTSVGPNEADEDLEITKITLDGTYIASDWTILTVGETEGIPKRDEDHERTDDVSSRTEEAFDEIEGALEKKTEVPGKTEVLPGEEDIAPNETGEAVDGIKEVLDETKLPPGKEEEAPGEIKLTIVERGDALDYVDQVQNLIDVSPDVTQEGTVGNEVATNKTQRGVDGTEVFPGNGTEDGSDNLLVPPKKTEEMSYKSEVSPGDTNESPAKTKEVLEWTGESQEQAEVSNNTGELFVKVDSGSLSSEEGRPNGTAGSPERTEVPNNTGELFAMVDSGLPCSEEGRPNGTAGSAEQTEVPNNTGELFVKVDSGSLSSEEGRPNGTAGSPERTEVPNDTGELFAMVDSGLPCSEEGRPNGTAGSPEQTEVPNNTGELFAMVDSGSLSSEEGRPNGTAEYPERTEVPNNTGELFAMVDSGLPCSEEGRPNGTAGSAEQTEVPNNTGELFVKVDSGSLSSEEGRPNGTAGSPERTEVPNDTGELFAMVDSGLPCSEEGRPNGTAGSPEQTEVPNNTGELFAMVDSGSLSSEEGRPNGTAGSPERTEVSNNTGELFAMVDSGLPCSEEGRPNGTAGSPEQTEVPNNTGELFAMVDSGLPCSEEGRPNGTAEYPEWTEVPNNTGERFAVVDSGLPCSEEGRPNGTAEYPERTEVPNNTGELFAMVDSGLPCSEEGRPNGTGQVTNEMEVTAQEVDTGLLSGFAGHVNREVDSELIVRSDETTKVPFQPEEDPGQVEGGVFVKEGDPDKVRHNSEEGLCEVMRCNGNLMTTMKQMNIEEVFSGCSTQKEDLQMTDTLVDQESGIADNNIIVCKLTVSETTELVGTKPYFGITVPVVSDHVTPDTEKELLRDDEFTAVSKDSKDLTEHQERQNFELENQAQTDSMVESLVSLECFKDKTVGLHSSEKIEIGVREQHNLNLKQNDIAISEVKDFKGNAKTDSFKICEELLPQSSQECDQIESSDHDGAFTLKENLGVAGDWSSGAEVRKASDPNLVSLEEETGEISQDKSKILAYDQSAQNSDSRDFFSSVNVNQSGWHITRSTNPAADFEQNSSVNNEDVQVGELRLLNGNAVLQHVDADALLSETVTSNPLILGDLAHCLDTEYQYGMVPCWRDLAELLAIPREVYWDCGTLSITSPTEDLFVFLSATKPQLTIAEIKEALTEIDRLDVAQLLERTITGGVISNESVVTSLVERQDLDILGKMALKLDRKMLQNWKHLALQLSVPHRVLRNFGPCQQYNSSKMLLKYIPVFDPELTLDKLKASFSTVGLRDAVAVLESAGIPGDQPIKNILDDSAFVDQIAELLNDDPPSPNWRHLARELKIPVDKWKVFEPTEDNSSPTRLLFKSIAKCEPDLTFEELVLALVAMKRQDVLDILQKYFSSDDIDQILEENNLLVPMEPDETQDNTE